jgi:hypothetical protein
MAGRTARHLVRELRICCPYFCPQFADHLTDPCDLDGADDPGVTVA